MQTIPNNQDAIARSIAGFGAKLGCSAVGDDGNVCVQAPNKAAQEQIAAIAREWFGNTKIGDGVQTGGIFINCDGQDTIEI